MVKLSESSGIGDIKPKLKTSILVFALVENLYKRRIRARKIYTTTATINNNNIFNIT